MTPRARRHILAAAAATGGLVLFAYAIRNVGWPDIAAGIRRVGWGLAPILALSGLRFLLRAECWRRCMAPDARIPLSQAFVAFLAGDAVGNVTPLGLFASEPAKVFLTRHHLATREAVASLAAENLVYSASVVTVIGVGVVVVLATMPVPAAWQWVLVAALAAGVAGAALAWRVLQGTWDEGRGARPWWRERVARVRVAVVGILAGHPARLWRAYSLDLGFHALG